MFSNQEKLFNGGDMESIIIFSFIQCLYNPIKNQKKPLSQI